MTTRKTLRQFANVRLCSSCHPFLNTKHLKVSLQGAPETFCIDHWRCRFQIDDSEPALDQQRIFSLLSRVGELGFDVIKTEHLYYFNGKPGFSLGQGQ